MVSLEQVNWDDVRVFLAVMRANSLRQAAAGLCVSHPTVRRRLAALEEQVGLRLFDRHADGLHATAHAMALIASAEDVERAMSGLKRAVLAADPDLRGPVRVTMPDIVATDLLMPDLVAFQKRWPQIQLFVHTGYAVADLSRREADVAVRLMPHGKAPDETLAGRLAGTAWQAVYGEGDGWIGRKGAEADADWVAASPYPDLPVLGGMNDGMLQRAACAEGLGLALMPCFFAEPLLTRRTEPTPAFDIWVLVHPDLRRNPRLRIFRDAVVSAVRGYERRLVGGAQ